MLKGYEDGPAVRCGILIWMPAKLLYECCKQRCQKRP